MKPSPSTAILLLLVVVSMLGPFSLNVLVPSLPGLSAVFTAPREQVQLALSLFIVGMAFSQLLAGPLADRFGRRPVLLAATGLYLVASTAAALAGTIGALVAARIVQALGATVGITLARAIVRDLYSREAAASVIGYVTMGMMVAPMIAPSLGGLLDEAFGWRAVFVACVVLGVGVLLATAFMLTETRPPGTAGEDTAGVMRRTGALFRRPIFLAHVATAAFASAIFFTFLGAAPYLVIEVMGLGKADYGLWFVAIALAYMVGNFISGRWSQRIGIERMIFLGNVVGVASTLASVALAILFPANPVAFFVPAAGMSLANGLVLPNVIAAAVSVDPEAAGAASGILGFTQMALGALATFAAGLVATSVLPIALGMAAWAALALVAGTLARRARGA